MMKSVKTTLTLLLCLLLVAPGSAFAPVATRQCSTPTWTAQTSLFLQPLEFEEPPLVIIAESEKRGSFAARVVSKVAGLVSGLCGFVARGMAEDVEYAELPPPYVPALFGVVLLAGVGILTVSLGDVMQEEAQLGLQSGARAKKEIERSRSSYFKRK